MRTLASWLSAHRPLKILPALLIFLTVMALTSLERLAILLLFRDRLADAPTADILRSFAVGLRFDSRAAALLALPVLLASLFLPHGTWRKGAGKLVVAAIFTVVTGGAMLLCLLDILFFAEFDHHMDGKAFHYLPYAYTYHVMLSDFPLWIPALGTIAAAWAAGRKAGRGGLLSRVRMRRGVAMTAELAAVALLLLAARNSFGQKAINSSLAYFSPSLAVAQLTLNGFFTLGSAFESEVLRHEDLANLYPPLPADEAAALARDFAAGSSDRFVEGHANPLMRVTDSGAPERKLNVVLVIMESLSWHYIAEMGGEPGLTPRLNKLCREGLLMEQCYAVGERTTRGVSGILGGFPDLPGASVTTRAEGERGFLTLAEILRRRGYRTMFTYGGDPLYDHRRAFLGSNGVKEFVFGSDFASRTFKTHLGWCDEDLYNEAHCALESTGDTPLFLTLLTLSYHRPYDVPDNRVEPVTDARGGRIKEYTSIRYADWALGQFMDRARQSSYFDRTIFVFVADHTGGKKGKPILPPSYRVPFLVVAPDLQGDPRRISTVCSQTDVAPTIMHLLGGSYTHCFFGSSVLDRPEAEGRAFLQHGTRALAFVDADQWTAVVGRGLTHLHRIEPPGRFIPADPLTPELAERRDSLARRGIAVLQTADSVFRSRLHILPPEG